MKIKREIMVLLGIFIVGMCNGSIFENIINDSNFNPILSLEFTVQNESAICKAHGLLPVTYTIKVLYAGGQYKIDNNIVEMKYRNIYLIICKGKVSIGNSTWTKTVLMSYWYNVPTSFVRLVNGDKPNEGLIQFTDIISWSNSCADYSVDNTNAILIGNVICHELGYSGLYDIKYNLKTIHSLHGMALPIVRCNGNENSVDDCSLHPCFGFMHNKWAEHTVNLFCLKTFHRFVDIKQFQSNPSSNLDVNQEIEVKCTFEFSYKTNIIFEMWRIKGSSEKMSLVNEFNSTLNIVTAKKTQMTVSYIHKYKPDKTYPNDTFVCIVKDGTGGFISKKELILKYKYPVEQLILEPIANTSDFSINTSDSAITEELNASTVQDQLNVSDSTIQNISNASTIKNNTIRIPSHIKCSGDYEIDNANFTWSYTGTNGTNYFTGQILDLNKVERRLPVCCRLDHKLRSGPYNISKCTTIQESPEIPVLKTSKFCGTRSMNIKCPESTDMVFSSIHAGYLLECTQTVPNYCQHYTITNFIKEERCTDDGCRIFTGLFKKAYFKPNLDNLPSSCLNGTKPFIKIDYYCLKGMN